MGGNILIIAFITFLIIDQGRAERNEDLKLEKNVEAAVGLEGGIENDWSGGDKIMNATAMEEMEVGWGGWWSKHGKECAKEWGTCHCKGVVYYNDPWVKKNVYGSIRCTTKAFGRDPRFGHGKTCYCHPTKYSECATEYGYCRCNGGVVYGYGDRWNEKDVDGKIRCNNANFGDPYPGMGKKCICLNWGYESDTETETEIGTDVEQNQLYGIEAASSADKNAIGVPADVSVEMTLGMSLEPNLINDEELWKKYFLIFGVCAIGIMFVAAVWNNGKLKEETSYPLLEENDEEL